MVRVRGPTANDSPAPAAKPAAKPAPAAAPSSGGAGGDDNITDDEFEDLLDQLHGAGKGPATESAKPAKSAPEKSSG